MSGDARRGGGSGEKAYAREAKRLRVALLNAQFDLRRARAGVLVLLAGDDRVGCGEVVRRLHTWMDARYMATRVFDRPGSAERERPPFYRHWRALPAAGQVGLHLGGWAWGALAERLGGALDDAGFERRLDLALAFERALLAEGWAVCKLWLHLPRAAQRRRLERADAEADALSHLEEVDRTLLERWERTRPFAARLLERTATPEAPWRRVDGSDERRRDLEVGGAVRDALADALEGRVKAPAAPPAPPASGAPSLRGLALDRALPRPEYKERLRAAQVRIARASREARERGLPAVFVFEGGDAAGKGGVIRRIAQAMAVRDLRVVPVGPPDEAARAHPWLWRFWRALPRAGRTVVFDRSWYGRVLVERVEGLAAEAAWRRAYAEIREFEAQLVEHGTLLAKFWLHIDADEQARRFRARARSPYKKYKLTDEDRRNRRHRDAYDEAAEEMFARTHAPEAPWRVVPANDKRYARVAVVETLAEAFEGALRDAGAEAERPSRAP